MKRTVQRIKISSIDITNFPKESLVVSSYWEDLYKPKQKNNENKKRI